MKFSKNKLCMLKLAVAGASALGAQAALAQDFFFIEHKPTDLRFHSCSDVDGTAVTAEAGSTSACAHWQQVPVGDFFFIKSRTGKHIRPDSADNGSPIVLRPNTWTGNWAQWSIVDKGEFGHLKNRATGKYVFIPAGGDGQNLEQQPSTWQGDYTQWKFIPVGSTPDVTATPTVTPTATVTPTTTPTATPTITATPTVTPTAVVTSTPTATPTPACTSIPASTTSYEAESGALTGSARTYDDSAASGGQGVAFLSELGASVSITNVQPGSSFDVTYASQAAGSISYSINGADAGNITFETTGNWTGAYNTVTVNADIPQNATIEIFYDNGDAAMNVDKISVTSEGSNCGGNPTVTPTATPTSDPVGNTVNVSNSAEFGNFLVAGPEYGDKANFTLYTWDRDNGGPQSNCNSTGCLNAWPPLVVDSADDVVAPEGVNLSTTIRQDDRIQVTLNNEPLYFFAGDREIGDTNGHGLDEGTWLVADLGGPVVTPTPTPTVTVTPTPTPTPTPPTGGGSSDGDFCLTHTGNGNAQVTHTDLPEPASGDQYLCLNGNCQPARLNDGKWAASFSGLTEGQNYEIKTQLSACNGLIANVEYKQGGSCVFSSCLPPDEQAPTTPQNLTGDPKNGLAVLLSWSASTDDRGVARYEVFVDGRLDGSAQGTSYGVSNLNELTDYDFSVRACDAADNCSAHAELSLNTGPHTVDRDPPTIPGKPVQGEVTQFSIAISWAGSTDALGVVEGYNIYRNGSLIKTITETSYVDENLESSTSYTYEINACDDSNNCSNRSQSTTIDTEGPDFSHINYTFNSFVTGKADGKPPRPNPIDALRTPISGIAPRQFGFAFDIDGNTVRWRFGSGVPNVGGVEMSCSVDNNMTFSTVAVNGSATIPAECVNAGTYTYFFRYLHPHSLNNDPAHQWIYTGLFTTAGGKFNPYAPGAYSFTDGSANWARIRHPITTDGITAAVLDRPQSGELLKNLDRYLISVDDSSGFVDFNMDVSFMEKSDPRVPSDVVPGFRRNEALRNTNQGPNGQQFFNVNTASKFGDDYRNAPQAELEGFEDTFSYGQVISFEFSVEAAGQSPAQTYNDFSHYVVGCGFCGKYGDPRLNSAGKAGTSQVFSDAGQYIDLERNAIFTQPLTTLYKEKDIDDFLVGHHLFHGIVPGIQQGQEGRNEFNNPDAFIGKASCGGCHFRDGRGDTVVDTPDGPRLPPPVYGVALLEWMEGRETGFGWEGKRDTVEEQVVSALANDHGVKASDLPDRVFHLLTHYVNVLTVPDRHPGSYDQPGVTEGDKKFNEIGCASCHTPVAKTRSDAPVHIRNLTIRPYTDMKLWNVNGGTFRTSPLWGLGQNLRLFGYNGKTAIYMHDGAAKSVHEAIMMHDGDAQDSKAAYEALSSEDQNNVVNFVKTL